MKHLSTALLAATMIAAAQAQDNNSLRGFFFGNDIAPRGHEWESPCSLAYNKELPRADFHSFANRAEALQVLPAASSRRISLDGKWQFSWVNHPDKRTTNFFRTDFDASRWDSINVPGNWNVEGLQTDGTMRYGKPIYVNQKVIFAHSVKPGDWRGGVMRTPPENWTTFTDRNEVGSYRRSFRIPRSWRDRRTYISFAGVDSFFYLWINGRYVGFSKNSRNAARFDITPFINPDAENLVAVEVYRNSDGSFLEAQDMFRLPGIFRSVELYSVPQTHIRNLTAIPHIGTGNSATLDITAELRNLRHATAKGLTISYSLHPIELYTDNASDAFAASLATPRIDIAPQSSSTICSTLAIANPMLWSAETPYRYVLLAEVKDRKGNTLETVATYIGIREVEIRYTPAEDDEFGKAGKYFYVNNRPVKLKGVNRHETSPERGHAITTEQMEKEVMLMKRANINHVRNSHYPTHPYFYHLADKYGIYIEDEANIESHEYYYGAASLSHVPEFRNAHIARNAEMVASTINHPSIVIWSLGNEAGPGDNFIAAYQKIKELDTSRPVQYERNNAIVDIGSNQYPSIAWTRQAATGELNIKYPFHISEYAHSMGNAGGGLDDYWTAIESSNHIMGGAIWDWVDQALYHHTPDSVRYLAYGGDFGDFPNDGQFVMNGLMLADLTPKPQYHDTKRVYQYVAATLSTDASSLDIFNKNYFTGLDDYFLEATLLKNGIPVDSITIELPETAPRSHAIIDNPFAASITDRDADYHLNLDFRLKSDKPWAHAGYPQAQTQLILQTAETQFTAAQKGSLRLTESPAEYVIAGKKFEARFSRLTGALTSLIYDGTQMIADSAGIVLDAMRAFTNNDVWIYQQWYNNGLHNLTHTADDVRVTKQPDGTVAIHAAVTSQSPVQEKILGGTSSGHNSIKKISDEPSDFKFTTNQIWTIAPDGRLKLDAAITSTNPTLTLPRLGFYLQMPKEFDDMEYYGKGPHANYPDRQLSERIGIYKSTTSEQMDGFAKPQSTGNHQSVRRITLSNNDGHSLTLLADTAFSVTALPYSESELIFAPHPHELPEPKATHLHIDIRQSGLGGASCGQGGPTAPNRIMADVHHFGFTISPDANAKPLSPVAKPIAITRDKNGDIHITSANRNAKIEYSTDGKKFIPYDKPIAGRAGITLTAVDAAKPFVVAKASFPPIVRAKAKIISASSQETDGGEADNVLDDDPATIWHTAYSVTVAQPPHWIDFELDEPQLIKQVNYTTRTDGSSTGNVADYEIALSDDAQDWHSVAKGTLPKKAGVHKIVLPKPAKARYLRFIAHRAADNRDYASAAEIEIITD